MEDRRPTIRNNTDFFRDKGIKFCKNWSERRMGEMERIQAEKYGIDPRLIYDRVQNHVHGKIVLCKMCNTFYENGLYTCPECRN